MESTQVKYLRGINENLVIIGFRGIWIRDTHQSLVYQTFKLNLKVTGISIYALIDTSSSLYVVPESVIQK